MTLYFKNNIFLSVGNLLYGKGQPENSYWIARDLFIRGLGLIYFVAFLILLHQGIPLLGENGLLPIAEFMQRIEQAYGWSLNSWLQLPSLFWFSSTDFSLKLLAYSGCFFALFLIAGFANFPILFILWLLHLSVVNSGQLFYGYGWETQLLEMTFLSFFFCPLWKFKLFEQACAPPVVATFFFRWTLFRMMFGAGLIKIRGDSCWTDLTCMFYHYETQPNPHALSWFMHQMPAWFHKAEILFNHFVELIVPFGLLGPKYFRRMAGLFIFIFQVILILSGNLSWLNWVTLILAFCCWDDALLASVIPKIFLKNYYSLNKKISLKTSQLKKLGIFIITCCIAILSIKPISNLLARRQMMNASFDQFHLINTYGAFGSITKKRNEIIIKGTHEQKITPETQWLEYEFKCKPGALDRRPCFITPYHYRLDWQIWFSAMRPRLRERWLLRFAYKLLQSDKGALSLLNKNPFIQNPPTFIKMDLYHYQFSTWQDNNNLWWKRTYLHEYLPAISL